MYGYSHYDHANGEWVRRKTRVCTKPKKIDPEKTVVVNAIATVLLADAGFTLAPDIKIYAVNQRKGYWSSRKRYLVIPIWAINKSQEYAVYYTAHELAHALCTMDRDAIRKAGGVAKRDTPHGPTFMKKFMEICPKEAQHHELGYKPRNAKAAGITRKSAHFSLTTADNSVRL